VDILLHIFCTSKQRHILLTDIAHSHALLCCTNTEAKATVSMQE
jgi:hypothetical protein